MILDRGRAVYAVYAATEHATTLADRIVRLVRKRKVRRVIVDVRLNGGGDEHVLRFAARRAPAPARQPSTQARPAHRANHVLRGRQLRRGRSRPPRVRASSASRRVGAVQLRRLGARRAEAARLDGVRAAAVRRGAGPEGPAGRPPARRCRADRRRRPLRRPRSGPREGDRPPMRRALSVLAVAGALLGCVAAQAQTGGLFAYDASRPLQVRQASSTESGGVRVVELSYASPKGGRVPATLVLPAAEGRYPAVVFQHGGGDARRSDFRAEAEDFARAGLASLLVDAPFNRPPYRAWLTFQLRDRAAYVRTRSTCAADRPARGAARGRSRAPRARRLQLRRRPRRHRRRRGAAPRRRGRHVGTRRITDALGREGRRHGFRRSSSPVTSRPCGRRRGRLSAGPRLRSCSSSGGRTRCRGPGSRSTSRRLRRASGSSGTRPATCSATAPHATGRPGCSSSWAPSGCPRPRTRGSARPAASTRSRSSSARSRSRSTGCTRGASASGRRPVSRLRAAA